MSGHRLNLDPFDSPRLALLLAAQDLPCTASELLERVRASGYAPPQPDHHPTLWRLVGDGLLRQSGRRYALTDTGRLYREACGAGLSTAGVRLLSCLSAAPVPYGCLTRYARAQGWGSREQTSAHLRALREGELVTGTRRGKDTHYALTPLGLFTQGDIAPAFTYLGLTVCPLTTGAP